MSKAAVTVNDKVWKKILSRAALMERATVKVGVFHGQNTADGLFDMVELAAIHEFGSEDGRIPERSWIRAAINSAESEIRQLCAELAGRIMMNKLEVEVALKILGEKAIVIIKNYVTQGSNISPTLKLATIAAKGSDRPLIDTGAMINSLAYELGTE